MHSVCHFICKKVFHRVFLNVGPLPCTLQLETSGPCGWTAAGLIAFTTVFISSDASNWSACLSSPWGDPPSVAMSVWSSWNETLVILFIKSMWLSVRFHGSRTRGLVKRWQDLWCVVMCLVVHVLCIVITKNSARPLSMCIPNAKKRPRKFHKQPNTIRTMCLGRAIHLLHRRRVRPKIVVQSGSVVEPWRAKPQDRCGYVLNNAICSLAKTVTNTHSVTQPSNLGVRWF